MPFKEESALLATLFVPSLLEGSSESESINWNLLSGLTVNLGNTNLLPVVSKFEEDGALESGFFFLADCAGTTPCPRKGNFELLHTERDCIDGGSSASKENNT